MKMNFKENQERARLQNIERQKRLKKEMLKEKILMSLVAIYVIATVGFLLDYINVKAVNSCMGAGNNKAYCEEVVK